MSYLDALSLYGGDWNTYMSTYGKTELDYTLYVDGNPVPDYYYSDAPTDTTLSSTYRSTTGFDVTIGSPHTVSDDQTDLITYYLSATSDIAYRVSFSDVSTLTFHQNNSPDATGEIFISAGDITDGNTLGATGRPSGSSSSEGDFVGDVVLSNDGDVLTPGTAAWDMTQLGTSQIGAYAILHELGHSVGLIHTQDAFGDYSIYDSQKYSIMTASAVSDHDPDMDSSVHPTGLQLLDIAVLQSMYGVNWGGINGEGGANENTVYSHASSFTTSNAYGGFIYTIWDGAGTDVIDATGYTTPAEIDLRQGHFSSIGYEGDSAYTPVAGDTGVGTLSEYDAGNVAIAYFAVIENAIGTCNDDTLIGNAWNNVLYGGAGNDTIYGDGVTYDGDAGAHAANANADSSSTVYGWGPDAIAPATDLSGNDILIGGAGDDYFYGGQGNDVIHGGYVASDITGVASGWDPAGEFTGTNNANGAALSDISYSSNSLADGFDTVDYSQLPVGSSGSVGIDVVFEDTTAATLTSVIKGYAGEYGTDTLFSIDAIQGTPWNDTFEGTANLIFYHAMGSAGNDTYLYDTNDSPGFGTVDYSTLDSLSGHIALVINGSGGTVDKSHTGGSLGEDTLGTNIHYVIGTSGDDTFSGMIPGSLVGFTGGAGNDTYSFNMNALDAGPTTASVTIGEDSGGSLSNVTVSNFDIIVLNSYVMDSATTSDTTLSYEKWNSGISAYDVLTLEFVKGDASGIDTATIGSTTYEFGGYTDNTFTGATGAHSFYSALGTGTIDYSAATGGVTADLSTGIVSSNGWGYADTLSGISIILSSHHNDSITGDGTTTTVSYADATSGVTVDLSAGTATGDGSDTLSAVSNVIGSSHNDTITGDSSDNVIDGGAGDNTLDGGGGTNTLDYSHDPAGVTVNLSTGTATNGYGGTDTISNFQNVIGSDHGDTITGSSDNVITGGAGDDLVINGSGSNTYDGGGGTNTLSYENDAAGVTVDLSAGTATNGSSGTDTISNFQNVIGSAYDDTITGDSNDNVISGGGGDNTLDGGGGTNTLDYSHDSAGVTVDLSAGTAINGSGGTDTISNFQNVIGSDHGDTITTSTGDNNVITDGAGDDLIIVAGSGVNNYDGGGGTNTLSYELDPSGAYVDMSSGVASNGFGGTDSFSNFQNVIGSAYDDVIIGDSNNNVISGGGGDNSLDGGGGTNTLDYSHDSASVTVDLADGWAINGSGGTDTIANFQNVLGSNYGDTIYGSSDNVITGGSGDDLVINGSGSNTYDGGGGTNTLSYQYDPAGVTVDLSAGTATNGSSGTDTISNFQNVIGSDYDDTITGDSQNNVISGGAGNNALDGGGGINTLDYSNDWDSVTVDLSAGTATNGAGGTDTITNFQNVIGSAYDDVITGDSNDNVISGGAGYDTLDGGGGTNTLDYSHDPGGIVADLTAGTVYDGFGYLDTVSNFQNIIGSAYDDVITGDANDNVISGGGGNNTLDGGGGVNTLDYSHDPSGVTVDLSAGTATNGYSGTDTLSNFQVVIGSHYDNTITGDGSTTIDYSHAPAGVTVDLSLGTASNGWGGTDTLSQIGAVMGSHFDDTITGDGNTTVNYAHATGAVTVDLSAGTAAGDGSDTLVNIHNIIGSAYGDTITGDSSNDVISGGGGDNILDGGGGINTLDYSHDPAGVTVDLSAGTATNGWGGTDTISNFQNVIGSAWGDNIMGDSNDNVISVRGANNELDGNYGTNTVDYSAATGGVTVDLSMGVAIYDGFGGTDYLNNFQVVIGSHHDDTITGDGTSTVSYANATGAVTVDLSAGTATGDGNDTLSGIPNVTGSGFDDTITGDSNDNILYGNGGNDYITGGAGADTFLFKGATALTGVTTIADFNTGDGDKIDIADVLQGHYDPLSDAITDFVSLAASGSDTLLKVDLDGTGGTYSPTTIALLHGVTGLDVATLISDSNLVVPT